MKSAPTLPPERRQLLLCRHAKSSWQDHSLGDVDRPLNKRGQRDAPEMGSRLRRHGLLPDLIVASHAVRARTTAELYAMQLGYPCERIRIDPGLYAASPQSLLALLRHLPAELGRVMLVGHNPELTALANLLGQLGINNVPTSGIVGFELTVPWTELAAGSGRLLFFDFPKHVE